MDIYVPAKTRIFFYFGGFVTVVVIGLGGSGGDEGEFILGEINEEKSDGEEGEEK